MAKKSSRHDRARTAEAIEQNGAQTATVEVTDKGFDPSSLKLKASVLAKVPSRERLTRLAQRRS